MNLNRSKLFYYFLFGLGMILVGSSVVIGKELTTKLPVFFTVEIRLLISIIIFYAIIKIRKEIFPALTRKDYSALLIQSLSGIFLYNILLFYGLRYTSGLETGVILSLSPIFAAVLSLAILKEKVSAKRWVGIFLAVVGVVVINIMNLTGSGVVGFSLLKLFGNLMIIGVALSEAIFAVTSKYNRAKLSAYQICLAITVISFIAFLPFSIYEALKVNYSSISVALLLQLAYYVVFVGLIPYVLTFTAIKYISATTAGVLTVLIPISSILLSILFLGDEIRLPLLMGAGISIIGVFIVAKYE